MGNLDYKDGIDKALGVEPGTVDKLREVEQQPPDYPLDEDGNPKKLYLHDTWLLYDTGEILPLEYIIPVPGKTIYASIAASVPDDAQIFPSYVLADAARKAQGSRIVVKGVLLDAKRNIKQHPFKFMFQTVIGWSIMLALLFGFAKWSVGIGVSVFFGVIVFNVIFDLFYDRLLKVWGWIYNKLPGD